jgi:hypothetical protein
MDVIGFLCVSLGSSLVQLYDSVGSKRACACSDGVSVVKMTTMLEECSTEYQRSVMHLLGRRTQCKGYS